MPISVNLMTELGWFAHKFPLLSWLKTT